MQYNIKISGSAPVLYPVCTYYGSLCYDADEELEIPKRYPFQGEWGQVLSNLLLNREEYPMPFRVDVIWLEIIEKHFYYFGDSLPVKIMEELWKRKASDETEPLFQHIVVGMAPYGGIAIWLNGYQKSQLINWEYGKEIEAPENFFPAGVNLNSYCEYYINEDSRVRDNIETYGLPPRDLFDNYMKQFTYRYKVTFGCWDGRKEEWQEYEKDDVVIPELDYIEEALYDGTHDKLHDGGLQNYHQAGKPKKLAVAWHINKSEYTAYFWFEDEAIRKVFDRFYGAHPDTKTDFMIRIDAEKNKYELALYRYGLKEPVIISPSAYQLLVFKNKFECYRSENYNQPRGAWIW